MADNNKTGTNCPKYKSSWMRLYWRPAMAWSYFVICLFDFLVAPLFFGIVSSKAGVISQWVPLTLQGNGLYHLAMCAIVGAYAWGRSQEKIWENRPYYDPYNHYNYRTSNQMQPMIRNDPIQDDLSYNEDEIIPPNPQTR